MKTPILSLLALAAFAASHSANAQTTTYSVIKVTGSLPCFEMAADFQTLLGFKLSTNAIINIALDRDVATKVPKNVILGFAGNFAAFGNNSPNTSAPVQLVVFDKDTQQKMATIAVAGNRTVKENLFVNKFRRVGLADLNFMDTGGTNSKFVSGKLTVSGVATRTPNDVGNPATLKVSCPTTVQGQITFDLLRTKSFPGGGKATTGRYEAIITKGSLIGSGKVLGTFTE